MSAKRVREAERLARLCRDQGFRVRETRSGYVAYAHRVEDGTAGWHRTPSDHRWIKNALASLRRIGVRV
jgi:hypothetical protein